MLTIKYLWLYMIILLSSAGGFGAAYVALPSDQGLGRQLLEARMEIDELKKRCLPARKRVPIQEGSKKGF